MFKLETTKKRYYIFTDTNSLITDKSLDQLREAVLDLFHNSIVIDNNRYSFYALKEYIAFLLKNCKNAREIIRKANAISSALNL